MRDVGLSLAAASHYNQLLNRIRLQKFVYLLDVMVYLVQLLPPSERHVTYKHGPYDAGIQNAVDCLAFRGLARISEIQREPDGKTYARYALTTAGMDWVSELLFDPEFRIRSSVAASIAKEVNSIGWEQLRTLVYAEPTFVSARSHGYGTKLEPNDPLRNSAALVLETMKRGLRSGLEKATLSPDLLFRLFFRYLKEFSQLKDQRLGLSRIDTGGEF